MADNAIRTCGAFRAEIFEFYYQGFSANGKSSHSKLITQDVNRIVLLYRRYGTLLSSIRRVAVTWLTHSCMAVYETSSS